MQLSRDREAELMEKNMPKIYRAVDNFMARYKNRHDPCSYDDLSQQVAEAFLLYIRRCKTEEELNKFPWFDALHAMSVHVLNSQPFGVPKSTKTFSQIIHNLPQTVSYEVAMTSGIDVDGMSKHWVPDKETEIDFNDFMSEQDESVRRIASMRIYGMSHRQIAGQFGVCKTSITKKLDKLREDYAHYSEEEDDNE